MTIVTGLAAFGGRPSVTLPRPHHVWPRLADESIEEVRRYLVAREPLSLGDGSGVIAQLERELADALGLAKVLTVSSGTAALHAGYLALDLPVGSEVIAPVFGFHASVTPALHCGLRPVLVDVDADTGNLNVEAARQAITDRTSCVVVNHTWGHPADLDPIVDLCRRHGLALIEDCSHAYGSTYKGRPVGTFGDIAAFSMQANKMLPAGEGGFLGTADERLYERALLASHYRGRAHSQVTDVSLAPYGETGFGLKYRLAPLVAVVARAELARLPQRMADRTLLLDILGDALRQAVGVEPPTVRPEVRVGAWFGYKPAFVPGALTLKGRPVDRAQYVDLLVAEGVDVHVPSVPPLRDLPLFQTTPPLRIAELAWKPQLEASYPGLDAYIAHRLSVPAFSFPEQAEVVAQYAAAFAKIGAVLGGPDAAKDDR